MTHLRRHRIVIEYTAPADTEHLALTTQAAAQLHAQFQTYAFPIPDATDIRVYDEVAPLPSSTLRLPQ